MAKVVNIECTLTECKITTAIPQPLLNKLSHECSFYVDGYQYMPLVKEGKWDGRKKLFHRGYKTFPTGLLRRVIETIEGSGREVNQRWEQQNIPRAVKQCNYPDVSEEYSPRPYQRDVIDTAKDQRHCMLRVATGGGKTVIAGHLIAELGFNTIFLVHTKDLLYQAYNMFCEMIGPDYIGIIGDGLVEPSRVTICTIQTAAKALGVDYEKYSYEEDDDWQDEDTVEMIEGSRALIVDRMFEEAGILFQDETHRVAAPTAMGVVMAVENAPYRFGLSASPWRDDGADLMLEGAFGYIATEISASELSDKGYLVDPVIRFKRMPAVNYGEARYNSIYKDYIVENEVRTRAGASEAMRMYNQGRSVLILVRWIRHGEEVQEILHRQHGLDVPFLQGRDTTQRRNDVLDQVRAGDLRMFIATTIADEGLDMKPLSGLVLLGGGKSSVRALQRVGRVLRPWPGKDMAEVIDFKDQAKYLVDHSEARRQIYEMEPNWIVV